MYDFFRHKESPLDLDKKKLKKLHDDLGLEKVEMRVGDMEYIHLSTDSGIEIKVIEDGLILLSRNSSENTLEGDIKTLTNFYEDKLSPAFSYLFSLGAPVPKELANIKTVYPYFVLLNKSSKAEISDLLDRFEQLKYFEIKNKDFEIYRGDKLYIINSLNEKMENVGRYVEEQIFIREFKGQLHRYLNLHRIIWEKIAEVKEKGQMKGEEIGPFFGKVQSYAKTINLIGARISQMGTYISTRESIAKEDPHLKKFMGVLEFKYETLSDTLSYVEDIWGMTENYVGSASELFSSIQARSTEASVTNLTIITSMGVGATLIGLFTESAPEFTSFGIAYFFILAVIGYIADRVMKKIAQERKYSVRDTEIAKDLE